MKLTNLNKLIIVSSVVLFFVILIWVGRRSDDQGLPKLDPYNHKSVILHFVMKNGTITKKMGKVVKASPVGDGGGGKVSHNVWKLSGDDMGKKTTGICDITLTKDKDKEYVVTKAMLTMQGTEFNISVKGLKGRKKSMTVIK